ncbi:hypothetical protein WG66_011962 [Moniliophthora roreri]|nr:hypothetical protein WG66_011962 [Moniliophthora roreri]
MPCMGTLLQRSPYETVKTIMTLRLSSAASSGVITIPQRHSCNSKFFAVLSKWVDISVVALGSLDSGNQ